MPRNFTPNLDLYDAIVQAKAQHRLCPAVREHVQVEEGNVDPTISFGGILEVRTDDPAIRLLIAESESSFPVPNSLFPRVPTMENIDWDAASRRRTNRIRAYVRAKQTDIVDSVPLGTVS